MKPTIGRTVHYRSPGSADGKYPPALRPAVITEVNDDDTINLMVMNPTGIHFPHNVTEGVIAGTWRWPEIK